VSKNRILFLDCEYNDFQGELISIALVPLDPGPVFYESLGCANPSPWVAEHVMPAIGLEPIDRNSFRYKLSDYLNEYGVSSVTVIADWPEDFVHLLQAFVSGPGMMSSIFPRLMLILRTDLSTKASTNPHNALADAIALRNDFLRHT
jgi:hypothetical protein